MKKNITRIGAFTTVAFGAAMLMACGSQSTAAPSATTAGTGQDQLVECYGVAKTGSNVSLIMTKDMCDKLPSSKQVVVNTSDYVQCYGVAASGQNGCAAKGNSCGGAVKEARRADAWVSLPRGVCENLKDAGVGAQNPASK